jgi:carbon storage regulator
MLVLTRKIDESLVIDDRIIVTVLAIDGDKVKLGITAPREVTILRQELWQAIREQNQIAEQLNKRTEPSSFEELRKFLAAQSGEEERGEGPAGEDTGAGRPPAK